jgi:DNA-binding MarR family transcriptional regulator
MKPGAARSSAREEQIAQVAVNLLPQVTVLARLVARQLPSALSRSEARVLGMLEASPRRITELADLDGVAQPTMTVLVKRLEQRGLVSRARQPEDERVVMVRLTDAGATALADHRSLVSVTVRRYLADMSDEQIGVLAKATEALDALIDLVQGGAAEAPAAGSHTNQKEDTP